MSKAAFILVVLLALRGCDAVPAIAEDPKPPEVPPALSVSQQIALKGIEEDENSLKQKWQILEAGKNAILAEFSKDHPGWELGPNNVPTKTPPAPAPPEKK